MTVAPATIPAVPLAPSTRPALPTVQPGVMFETSTGHRCDTFNVVYGARGMYECAHHMLLRADHARDAFLRAGEHR